MFTTKQYRAKAVENGELVKTSIDPNQRRDFQKIEQSFTVLADNEQWQRIITKTAFALRSRIQTAPLLPKRRSISFDASGPR